MEEISMSFIILLVEGACIPFVNQSIIGKPAHLWHVRQGPCFAGRALSCFAHGRSMSRRQREVRKSVIVSPCVRWRTTMTGDNIWPGPVPCFLVYFAKDRRKRTQHQNTTSRHNISYDIQVICCDTMSAILPHSEREKEEEHKHAFLVQQHSGHILPNVLSPPTKIHHEQVKQSSNRKACSDPIVWGCVTCLAPAAVHACPVLEKVWAKMPDACT